MIKQYNYIGNEFPFYSKIENQLNLIIDVGARDSFFTNVNCEVHYFEPDSEAYDNLKINKPNHFKNKLGLSSKNEIKKLYNQLGSTNYRPVDNINYNICENIQTITLDEYVEDKKIKKISLIKIDTEGMEYEVIKGAKKSLEICDWVVFEFAWDTAEAAGVTFNDIKNLLTKFEIYDIDNFGNLVSVNEEKITARIRPNTNNLVAKKVI